MSVPYRGVDDVVAAQTTRGDPVYLHGFGGRFDHRVERFGGGTFDGAGAPRATELAIRVGPPRVQLTGRGDRRGVAIKRGDPADVLTGETSDQRGGGSGVDVAVPESAVSAVAPRVHVSSGNVAGRRGDTERAPLTRAEPLQLQGRHVGVVVEPRDTKVHGVTQTELADVVATAGH